MKRIKRLLILVLVSALMISAFSVGASADNVQTITVNFTTVDKNSYSIDFPYSDDYFKTDCNVYSHNLAKASMGLTVASFRVGTETDAGNYLRKAGFSNIDTTPYETLPTTDSIANCMGSKKIDDFTLIAVGVCGGDYGKEWASNFKVGNEERAVGFNEAAQIVCGRIRDYIEKNSISGEIRLWVTGQSRAGAVSNIVAADMTDSGLFSEVFAYTFGTPRTTRVKGDYKNIFNIMSKDDVVPKVPLPDWGYERYGVDLYLPSQECDSDYAFRAYKAYNAIEGVEFRNNPELYSDYRVIFDYIFELMPTSEEYEQKLQETLISVIRDSDTLDRKVILKQLVDNFEAETDEQIEELKGFAEFIDKAIAKYVLYGNTAQIENGKWLKGAKIGSNMMVDHTVTTYASWIMSVDDGRELYSDNDNFIELTVNTSADVHIYSSHGLVQTIRTDGEADNACEGYGKNDVYISYTRNGLQVVMYIPLDRPYTVTFSPKYNEYDEIIAVRHTLTSVQPEVLLSTVQHVDAGSDLIIFSDDGEGRITIDNNRVETSSGRPVKLPMSTITQIENINVFNLSLSALIKICIAVASVFVAEMILHIILAIYRRKKGKDRSGLSVDVTFLANICFLMFAEIAVWYFAPAVDILNAIAELVTMLAMLFYAARGERKKLLIPLSILMAVIFAFDFMYLDMITLKGLILVFCRDIILVALAMLIGKDKIKVKSISS